MTCPNGHTGGAFCCEDNVNQIMAKFYETYHENYREPLIPVTLETWKMYQRIFKEQENGKGRLEEADGQGQV